MANQVVEPEVLPPAQKKEETGIIALTPQEREAAIKEGLRNAERAIAYRGRIAEYEEESKPGFWEEHGGEIAAKLLITAGCTAAAILVARWMSKNDAE